MTTNVRLATVRASSIGADSGSVAAGKESWHRASRTSRMNACKGADRGEHGIKWAKVEVTSKSNQRAEHEIEGNLC